MSEQPYNPLSKGKAMSASISIKEVKSNEISDKILYGTYEQNREAERILSRKWAS